jgi:hypothetical protein
MNGLYLLCLTIITSNQINYQPLKFSGGKAFGIFNVNAFAKFAHGLQSA